MSTKSQVLLGTAPVIYLGECPHCHQRRWLAQAQHSGKEGHAFIMGQGDSGIQAHVVRCPSARSSETPPAG